MRSVICTQRPHEPQLFEQVANFTNAPPPPHNPILAPPRTRTDPAGRGGRAIRHPEPPVGRVAAGAAGGVLLYV